MVEYEKGTKKHLGQHFLTDQAYVQALLSTVAAVKNQTFLEIGPGAGALTDGVLQSGAKLTAVEYDADCVAFLKKKYSDNNNLFVVHEDILRYDFSPCLSRGQPIRVLGNLPYNISTPVLLQMVEWSPVIQDAHFMLQQEVAQRCYAQPGQKTYGRLSVMLARHFHIESVLFVPDVAFSPPPKVQSEVIRMIPKETVLPVDEKQFAWVVQVGFAQRRKMLRKVFQNYMTLDDWSCLNIDASQRAEMLSLEDFIALTQYLEEKKR